MFRRARIEPKQSGVLRRRSSLSPDVVRHSVALHSTTLGDATVSSVGDCTEVAPAPAVNLPQSSALQRAQRARALRGGKPWGVAAAPASSPLKTPVLRRVSSAHTPSSPAKVPLNSGAWEDSNAAPAMAVPVAPAAEAEAKDEAILMAAEPPSTHWAWFTHEGGEGGQDKENQDTCIALQLTAELAVYAVFDGHGKQFGQLAALAARDALAAYLPLVRDELGRSPEAAGAVLRLAFLTMHDAVRHAMLEADPTIRVQQSERGAAYDMPSPGLVSPRAATATTPRPLATSTRPAAPLPPSVPPMLGSTASSIYFSATSEEYMGGPGAATPLDTPDTVPDTPGTPAADATITPVAVTPSAPPSAPPTAPRTVGDGAGWAPPEALAFVGGPVLLQWMEVEDPEPGEPTHKWDAVDGGTTASVLVLRRAQWAVIAAVGDSSVVLTADAAGIREQAVDTSGAGSGTGSGGSGGGSGGGSSGGTSGTSGGTSGEASAAAVSGEGPTVAELLAEEHSPTNAAECRRMRAFERRHGSSAALRFVYDCPDFEQFDIFLEPAAPGGLPTRDREAEREADRHECAVKNSRGDLFTVVNVPAMPLRLEPLGAEVPGGTEVETLVEEQAITMTRSLGDFYAHHHGVSCEPEITTIDFAELRARRLVCPRLVLASDGLWDLWTLEEVAAALRAGVGRDVPACGADCGPAGDDCPLRPLVTELCEATRAKGEDYFGEGADNLTGIVVDMCAYL